MIRSRVVVRLIGVLALLVGALPLFAAGDGEMEAVDPGDLKGELVYLEGAVSINGEEADIGDAVRPGDRIVTGDDSLAEITFGPENILQFREGTDSLIQADWSGVELERGTVAAVLNGLAALGFGMEKQFQVDTSTAVMAVRGTSFFVSHENVDEAYMCTCNGKLHIVSADGAVAEDTEAYHHAATWYVRTPDGIRAYPSGLHYHDDTTLEDIAEKAGTKVDWRD